MARLVPIDAAGDSGFVGRLRSVWEAGDTALPVDPRLPVASAERLVASMEPDRPTEEGDALVVATSGTTGEPKGVVLTHQAVEASARATSDRLGVDPARDRWLACLPLAHVGGLSVVLRAMLTGTAVMLHDGFDAARVQSAARDGATLVSLVGTALARIDPSPFRAVVLGGSAPPLDLPANVVTTYGMTETGSGVVYDGVPLDGTEVRTVDGELHVRGPMLLRAYRDGSDPKDLDGWLPTGDLGEVGEDGRVRVLGRADELIVTGGENVWPEAVERRLRAHHAVEEVAVLGRPDPEWGQRVTALVVPTVLGPPGLEELRDWVREELPTWCAPRELEIVDHLPRTSLGKLRRTDLR